MFMRYSPACWPSTPVTRSQQWNANLATVYFDRPDTQAGDTQRFPACDG
jgi:hypothetical protein